MPGRVPQCPAEESLGAGIDGRRFRPRQPHCHPVTLLILVTALVYGSGLGALYAMVGCVAAAMATYALGKFLGRSSVERLSGGSVERLSRRLARRGLLTVIALRIIPIAPFTVVNLFAGASHIRFLDYMLGTLIGMMPGRGRHGRLCRGDPDPDPGRGP
jgi:hypothetical protein